MKANAAAVLPGHSPVAAAKRMVVQAFVTSKKLEEESYRTLQQTKQWSSLPTAAHIVPIAESILYQQVQRYQKYEVVRVAHASFEVVFSPDISDCASERDPLTESALYDFDVDHIPMPFDCDEELSVQDGKDEQFSAEDGNDDTDTIGNITCPRCPIPRFRRRRKVMFDVDTDEVRCSCSQFERIGIPCVHMQSVIKYVHSTWEGFTHHQLAVRWWSVYISKGYPLGTTSPMSLALASLASSDLVAPIIPGFAKMLNDCGRSIHRPGATQFAWERVTNYEVNMLSKICFKVCRSPDRGDWEFMGHSQTTFDPENREDANESAGDLFARFENALDNDSKYLLMERKLRSFLSLYQALGNKDQLEVDARMDVLISQMRADCSKNVEEIGGTRSILVEKHGTSRRTFNTHNPYYK
jgi:hypothetical protein